MRFWTSIVSSCTGLLILACGHIEYGELAASEVAVVYQRPARVAVVSEPVAQSPQDWTAHVLPVPAHPPSPSNAAPTRSTPPTGVLVCGNGQRIRVHDEVVQARRGAAIVAMGDCIVDVTEAIVRGRPAIIAGERAQVRVSESRIRGDVVSRDGARVNIAESRIRGDLLRSGSAFLQQRGNAHRGRISDTAL